MAKRAVKMPCPICGGKGYRDKPRLRVVDSTCSMCGWHYTSRPRKKSDAGLKLVGCGWVTNARPRRKPGKPRERGE